MSDVEVLGTTRVSFIKRGVGSTNLSASAFSHDSGESISPMDSKVIRLNETIDLHPITITDTFETGTRKLLILIAFVFVFSNACYDPHAS